MAASRSSFSLLENLWNARWETLGLLWGRHWGKCFGVEKQGLKGENFHLSTGQISYLAEASFPLFQRLHHRHHLFIYSGSSEEMSR